MTLLYRVDSWLEEHAWDPIWRHVEKAWCHHSFDSSGVQKIASSRGIERKCVLTCTQCGFVKYTRAPD